jgi:hypothetical protein
MTESEIEIDLMELADLGQPTKIALEIHRQMRLQFGTVPRRLPLTAIAKAVGIEGILAVEGTSYDGKGAVAIRKDMPAVRRNFTLGHEIGHFLIPAHRLLRQNFICEPVDIRRVRSGNFAHRPQLERIEVEANEFSAALLVPLPEYGKERRALGGGCDVSHLKQLAQMFDVSQEMMANIYVANSDEKVAIITSHNGEVRSVIPQSGFPYLGLEKGVPIPSRALTHAFRTAAGTDPISSLQEVEMDTWLEEKGNVSALYEQVFAQDDGWVMTLLVVDEEETDGDEDDRDWNRRSSRH